MSGVNAHAVVQASGGAPGQSAAAPRGRGRGAASATVVWPCPTLDAILRPTAHGLLSAATSATYVFMLKDSAQNGALLEHQIRGRAVLPGAAGVAMMVAAPRTLANAR